MTTIDILHDEPITIIRQLIILRRVCLTNLSIFPQCLIRLLYIATFLFEQNHKTVIHYLGEEFTAK